MAGDAMRGDAVAGALTAASLSAPDDMMPPAEGPLDPARLNPTEMVAGYAGPALLVDPDGVVLLNNDTGTALGTAFLLGELPELSDAVIRVATQNRPGSERIELPNADGSSSLLVTLLPVEIPDGRRVLVLARDVTLERNMAKALLDSRQRYKDLVSCSTDFAWETNAAGRFGFVSPRGALGYQAFELEGRSAREFRAEPAEFEAASLDGPVEKVSRPGTDLAAWPFEAERSLDAIEVWLTRKDATIGCYEVSSIPVAGPDGRWVGARGVCRDVTEARRRDAELKRAYARLERLSRTDGLTGLLNRRAFHESLDLRLTQQRRHERPGALLYIDLDNFKAVNDVRGHAEGDAALRALADYLTEKSRAGDLVARLGGDEFAIVLAGLDAADQAAGVAEKIGQEVAQPIAIDGESIRITCSIGIAVAPQDGEGAAELMRNADVALHRAKQAGRDTHAWFTADVAEQAARRLALSNALRVAVDTGAFELFWQPQFDLACGHLSGFEALLRWRSVDGTLISPAEFIPLAEESGLILPIGAWVIDAACAQLARWRASGLQPPVIGVNVSGLQIARVDVAAHLRAALDRHGLPAGLIEVELTESSLMAESEHVADQLRALRELGVKLAIDDFGTGYSSLAYLSRLTVNRLKIDRAFVQHVSSTGEGRSIIEAIVAMARALGIATIAEGVEDAGQRAILAALKVDHGQGYLWSRPVPAEQAEMFMRSAA